MIMPMVVTVLEGMPAIVRVLVIMGVPMIRVIMGTMLTVGMIVLVGVFITAVLMIVIVSVIVFVLFRHLFVLLMLALRPSCLRGENPIIHHGDAEFAKLEIRFPVLHLPMTIAFSLPLRHSFHDLPLLVGYLHDRQTGVSHQIEIL